MVTVNFSPEQMQAVNMLLGDAYLYTAFFFAAFMFSIIFIAFIFLKTPAGAFLRASMGRRNVIVNPTEHGYLNFLVAAPLSRFSVAKKKKVSTFFSTNPEDRYTEGKSKVPCYINYGKFSFSLKPRTAFIMRKLKEEGITNWAELQNFMEKLEKEKQNPNEVVLKLNPKTSMTITEIADHLDSHGFKNIKNWDQPIHFAGESIDFDNIDMMYAENQRGDVIEAEIQRRTAAEIIKRLGMGGDVAKLLIVAGIVIFIIMIGFTVALNAIDMGTAADVGQAAGQAGGIVLGG